MKRYRKDCEILVKSKFLINFGQNKVYQVSVTDTNLNWEWEKCNQYREKQRVPPLVSLMSEIECGEGGARETHWKQKTKENNNFDNLPQTMNIIRHF